MICSEHPNAVKTSRQLFVKLSSTVVLVLLATQLYFASQKPDVRATVIDEWLDLGRQFDTRGKSPGELDPHALPVNVKAIVTDNGRGFVIAAASVVRSASANDQDTAIAGFANGRWLVEELDPDSLSFLRTIRDRMALSDGRYEKFVIEGHASTPGTNRLLTKAGRIDAPFPVT